MLICVFALLTACGSEESVEDKEYNTAKIPPPSLFIELNTPEIDSILVKMNQLEKVQQLFWLDLPNEILESRDFKLPQIAGYNHPENLELLAKSSKYFDSTLIKPSYYSKDIFLPLKISKSKLKWDRNNLDFISDSDYIKELDHLIPLQNYGCNNTFIFPQHDSTQVNYEYEKSIFDNLFSHKIILGKHSKDTLSPFQVQLQDQLIILTINDTIKKIKPEQILYNLSTSSSLDQSEQLLETVIIGDYDAAKIKITDIKDLERFNTLCQTLSNHSALDSELLDYKVRKIIAIKLWQNKLAENPFKLKRYEKEFLIDIRKLIYQSYYKSISLVNNDKQLLPLKDWPVKKWNFKSIGSKRGDKIFKKNISNYATIESLHIKKVTSLSLSENKDNDPKIIILNDIVLDSITGKELNEKVKNSNLKIILINTSHSGNLQFLKDVNTLIHCPNNSEQHIAMAAQAVMGGNEINGRSPIDGKAIQTSKTRLSYTIAEEVGILSDSLKKMDKIANSAIWGGATPGCQVHAAINGMVIYDKAFGYHTYERDKITNKNTVFDIASVTKVASTTLCAMKMKELGMYDLNDSLSKHLPDSLRRFLGHPSRLSNITFQELLTHRSGLPSGLPIYKFIAYIDSIIGKFDRYYCDQSDGYFCVEVADDFYLDSAYLDSMWVDMNRIWTGEKKYKYSDANMNVLYQIFRQKIKTEERYHEFIALQFYDKLHLQKTTFLPLLNLSDTTNIAPTEFDTFWRYQLLKGFVHDPNAALYGGVAGNAGVFSTAHELGILFQMLMRGGNYGGVNLLSPTTIKQFSRHQPNSHRGLGFDKPTKTSGSYVAKDCPYTAYGHTGFTGICTWNDPENEYSFIFVSNRVHPDPGNKKLITMGVRRNLHQVIYDQLYYRGIYKNKSNNNQTVTRTVD
ncbi:MAG: beta-N-acetylhexosaminidase [Flavobacteriales bacterium]|jgi:beta-N-acetylhexosaminidase